MKSINLLDVPITAETGQTIYQKCIDLAQGKNQHFVATPNNEILLASETNLELKSFLKQCTLNFPDSNGLIWAAAYKNNRWNQLQAIIELMLLPFRKKHWKNTFPERVTGSDGYFKICELAAKSGVSVFFLGGMDEVPEKNYDAMKKRFPNLDIKGFYEGTPKPENDKTIRQIINQTQPQILFICYGCPNQERWIQRNLEHIPSVKVAMGIGGSFDFAAGTIKRAPQIFQALSLEWFWRLIQQPSRWKRIKTAVWDFPVKILNQKG